MAWSVAVTSMAALKVLPLLVTVAYLLPSCNAQVPFLGPCPSMETKSDFVAAKYLGKWYEAERYFALFELAGKCVVTNYTDLGDGIFGITNRLISSLTGIRSSIEGEARVIGRTDESKLTVRFPSMPVNFDAPYWILDTDYDNFAVVWSCTNFGLFNTRNAWILTRDRHPSLDVMQMAYAVIDKHGVSRAFFIRTDQRNCPTMH